MAGSGALRTDGGGVDAWHVYWECMGRMLGMDKRTWNRRKRLVEAG